jgi:hypothetical protein
MMMVEGMGYSILWDVKKSTIEWASGYGDSTSEA